MHILMGMLATGLAIVVGAAAPRDWQAVATGGALAALAAFTPAALGRALYSARGTTLVAPLVWAGLAVAAVVAAAITVVWANGGGADAAKWEFISRTMLFAPVVAMLGAKRPQNRAWQYIVAALVFVVAWPAIQSLVVRPGEALELHIVWECFCAILAVMWIGVQAASRFTPIAMCVSAGQIALFWNYLPIVPELPADGLRATGLALLATGAFLGAVHPLLSPRAKVSRARLAPWNRVWLDFRDGFGLVWWHPVMERANALARDRGIPIRLDWHGFRSFPGDNSASDASAAQEKIATLEMAKLETGLRNLLRRFVSNRWIDRRLAESEAPENLPNSALNA